jgi:hypothetical protein
VLNCDLVPVLDNKSALIFWMRVAFSLRSASVPHVVPKVPMLLPKVPMLLPKVPMLLPKVPMLLPKTVADTSNPAETNAPDVFLEMALSSRYESLWALLYFRLLSD